MKKTHLALALAVAFPLSFVLSAAAQTPVAQTDPATEDTPVKSLGMVTITGGRPTSLPTQIPTTIEGVTRTQIDQTINATDSEDVLKYFPSLVVRRRYIGDYNHAVLSSRASGTGNSARSAVYADGILLSNYLGNGATYAPRWGMVTPEEIERADVMYGPFSAAYPGNSAGAIVDYVTRMPTRFEGHAKIVASQQNFDAYNTHETDLANQASTSLGSKSGDWSWWLSLNHTESQGQPMVFATKSISTTAAGSDPKATGAVYDLDKTNTPWTILGTNTQYHTVQDHAKLKLAYDISPTVRASYLLGNWKNTADGAPRSYLTDASGAAVYSGSYAINGQSYSATNLFNATKENLDHWMHGLSVKSNSKSTWDWELAASHLDYGSDQVRQSAINNAVNLNGTMTSGSQANAATLTDQKGTAWTTLAAKGIWRPQGMQGAHVVDFGVAQDSYQLRINKTNLSLTDNWFNSSAQSGVAGLNADVGGQSKLQSIYGQDAWAFATDWKTVLGLRLENWSASDGYAKSAVSGAIKTDSYAARNEVFASPKAALAYQWAEATVLKGSLGRAVRVPTVSELYGATTKCSDIATKTVASACPSGQTWVNDPNLRPEKSWTTELTLERDLGTGLLRLTYFQEDVTDSLYSQAVGTKADTTIVNMVQNIDNMRTQGLEIAFQGEDVFTRGLDLSGSITYADSRIKANSSYVATPGDTIDKLQPRVPQWRASALANYRWDAQLSTSVGVRYSGDQFSSLNNTDINGFAYTAASRFTVLDLRARYALGPKLVAAFGIDNLTNTAYWNYHQYPGRTFVAELKYDY
ncbi:MAG: TonB-dependent receptor [Betaproteobacteria bacterium]